MAEVKDCRHQYWDLGHCIDCYKTQNEIDDALRAAGSRVPPPRIVHFWIGASAACGLAEPKNYSTNYDSVNCPACRAGSRVPSPPEKSQNEQAWEDLVADGGLPEARYSAAFQPALQRLVEKWRSRAMVAGQWSVECPVLEEGGHATEARVLTYCANELEIVAAAFIDDVIGRVVSIIQEQANAPRLWIGRQVEADLIAKVQALRAAGVAAQEPDK